MSYEAMLVTAGVIGSVTSRWLKDNEQVSDQRAVTRLVTLATAL